MDIITGYLGEPHITAEQDRDVNIGVVGDGSYVMPAGQRLAAEVQTNNEVRIRDGVLIHQGCAASIKKNTYDTVTITNGSQGMKRIDLIVARYQRNVETGVESLDLIALQGTPAESDPAVPVHTEGDIQAGDAVADMPLYEVEKDGLNITRVTKVFEEVESLSSLNGKISSPYNLANCTFRKINKVVNGSGSSRQLFTLSKLNSIFGVSADRKDYDLFLWNGDGTNEVHIDGATYTPNNTTFYATLDRAYTGSIRIRGIVIYNPSTDGVIT